MIMKKKLLFLLLICSQFLFSQKKILLFSPESYQYKVQSEFVKKIEKEASEAGVNSNRLVDAMVVNSLPKA